MNLSSATMVNYGMNTNMKIKTFEEFLEEKFMDLREIGGMPITKDNYEDLYDSWCSKLDMQELIDFADKYGKLVEYETTVDIQDRLCMQANKLHDELNNK